MAHNHPTKAKADLIYYNAKIYTVDHGFRIAEAMAIKDGKIIEIDTSQQLLENFSADQEIDAQGKPIFPGLIDAHLHFLALGKNMRTVDLTGSKNFEEVLQRTQAFYDKERPDFLLGHGWDQTKWTDSSFPTRTELDRLFPDVPVILTRIDLHAMLVNQQTLTLANITPDDQVEGGEFFSKNGKLTGLLLDNAMNKAKAIIPELSTAEQTDALLKAQALCFANGITSVADAAMTHEDIQLLNTLSLRNKLQIGIYPMLLSTDPHLESYLFQNKGQNQGIFCKAIKVFGDGALGSRGSALKEAYSDEPNNFGQLQIDEKSFSALAEKIAKSDFQLNTHAIGDAVNQLVLKTYNRVLKNKPNRRWRIEHAQIVSPEDLKYFNKNCIPSIQPTHATSDMHWAEDRLGPKRIHYAYANKDLLNQAGLVAIGTDAPVEKINPFGSFYTAVARKDENGLPKDGFFPNQKLSREEALKGMTIWAAYAEFSEYRKGSLEKGKQADFIVLDRDIMTIPEHKILKTQVLKTYCKGQMVFQKETQTA